MHKHPVFLALSLVFASGASAHAVPQATSEDVKRQILFESMLYDGRRPPDLQDKAPPLVLSVAPPAPKRALPLQRQESAAAHETERDEKATINYESEATQEIAAPTEAVEQASLTPPVARPVRVSGMPEAMRVASTQPSAPSSAIPTAPVMGDGTLMGRAKAGDPDAEYQMGMMYAQDRPGGRSTDAASQSYYWFTQAASKGHARAQYNLGVMHAQGDGIVQNLIEAYIWFNLAAAQRMDGALQARDMVATSLTPDALMKAQERSTLYFQKISENRVRMAKEGPSVVVPVR